MPAAIPKSASPPGPVLSLLFSICTSRSVTRATNTQRPTCLLLQPLSTDPLLAACQRSRYSSLPDPEPATHAWTTVRSTNHPTTQLHAHLTGSISRECLHHIWEAKKRQDPALHVEDPLIAIPSDKVDYDLQTYEPSIPVFGMLPRFMLLPLLPH